MKTAAIIVNHNNYDDLEKLVSRIRDFDIFDAVVIVDNKSDDVSAVGKIAGTEASGGRSGKVVLIKADRNCGYGCANNIGMRWAADNGMTHAVIANPDTEFTEECIRAMLDVLTGTPAAASADASDGSPAALSADASDGSAAALSADASDGSPAALSADASDGSPAALSADAQAGVHKSTSGAGSADAAKGPSSCAYAAIAAPMCRTPESRYEAPASGWYFKTWGQELLSKGPVCRRIFNSYINKAAAVSVDGTAAAAAVNSSQRTGISGPLTADRASDKADDYVIRTDAVLGSLLAVDVARFNEAGGYDDDVFLYCEENIIGQKMKSRGYTTWLLTDQEYIHKHKPCRPSAKAIKQLKASEMIYFERYLGISGFLKLVSGLFLGVVYLEVLCCEKLAPRK